VSRVTRPPSTRWSAALAKLMATSRTLNNQTALARKTGVAQSTIGRICRREVDPQVGNLERIASAYGLTLAQLAALGQEPVTEPTDLAAIERSALVSLIKSMRNDIECAQRAFEALKRKLDEAETYRAVASGPQYRLNNITEGQSP
jgi:transcriptional regulator with XRE-family HTH domain